MSTTTLSREFKVQLIKAVFSKSDFDRMIERASPYELSDIQEFLWEAILYVGKDEQGHALSRDAVIARMTSTVDYWRSQLCGEPLDTCRGRSCFVSHPVCAGNKLKGQIEVIRQMFDRRKQRAEQTDDALMMLLMYHINDNNYAASGIYHSNRRPKLTVGSRVLDGDTLRNVIQAMNVAIAQTPWSEPFSKSIIVGEGLLKVHARKYVWERTDGQEFYVALTAPDTADLENLEKVFKKLHSGINRISANLSGQEA